MIGYGNSNTHRGGDVKKIKRRGSRYLTIEVPRDPEVNRVLNSIKARRDGSTKGRWVLQAVREKMLRDGLAPAEAAK